MDNKELIISLEQLRKTTNQYNNKLKDIIANIEALKLSLPQTSH